MLVKFTSISEKLLAFGLKEGTEAVYLISLSQSSWVIDGLKVWLFENCIPNMILRIVFYLEILKHVFGQGSC